MAASPFLLGPSDAERYRRLRRRMLDDAPWAFEATSLQDDMLGPGFVEGWLAREDHAILAVEAPATGGVVAPDLAAAAGLTRGAGPKFAHRARLWGVFVEPSHRGQGLGRAVVAAAVQAARGWPGVAYVDAGVSERSPAALRLYEGLGFRAWGREPEATEIDGRRWDELHMTLRLAPPSAAPSPTRSGARSPRRPQRRPD